MSLQGTLATFSIPDVMALLASTKKSGRLSVSAPTGRGEVWLDVGKVVAAASTGDTESDDAVTVLFVLLRFDEGDFVFEDGEEPSSAGDPLEVDDLLEKAGELAEEWAELEAVVPSADAWVSLAASLPKDEVEIDRDAWTVIVAVGSGSVVGPLGDALELDLIGVMRSVKGLVDDGLLEVADAPPAGAGAAPAWPPSVADEAPAADEPEPEPEPEPAEPEAVEVEESDAEPAEEAWPPPAPLAEEPEPADDAPAAEAPADAEAGEAASAGAAAGGYDAAEDVFDPNALLREMGMGDGDDGFLPAADSGLGSLGGDGEGDIDPADAAEMARQLANLSPEAAKAVAAAAKATSDAELEAALDEVVALDSSINRDLLLRFLGSVNS